MQRVGISACNRARQPLVTRHFGIPKLPVPVARRRLMVTLAAMPKLTSIEGKQLGGLETRVELALEAAANGRPLAALEAWQRWRPPTQPTA